MTDPVVRDETPTTGIMIGNSATCSDWLICGRPLSTKATSALVPPMSKVTMLVTPTCPAA